MTDPELLKRWIDEHIQPIREKLVTLCNSELLLQTALIRFTKTFSEWVESQCRCKTIPVASTTGSNVIPLGSTATFNVPKTDRSQCEVHNA